MTAAQLKRALRDAGLSQRGAAKRLEINERTMRRYVSGEQPIPRVVEYALYWLASSGDKL
jgi:transcriptional regulator with XRE-family HTH domain